MTPEERRREKEKALSELAEKGHISPTKLAAIVGLSYPCVKKMLVRSAMDTKLIYFGLRRRILRADVIAFLKDNGLFSAEIIGADSMEALQGENKDGSCTT